jgi:membrane associated rhomboid family serine protease
MFVPLYDYNPLRHYTFPLVTRLLVAVNVLVYVVFQSGLVLETAKVTVGLFGIIPVALSRGAPMPAGHDLIPAELTLLTYMFLHGHWMHLIGNMLFLWVFGDNVEDAMGRLRFFFFYLLCGISGGFAHLLSAPNSSMPLIGASGAIAGVVAAYLMLHPRVKIWVLVLMRIPLKLSAMWVLGFWVLFQISHVVLRTEDEVAWWAHVGGLIAGVLLVIVLRRPGVPLFDKNLGPAASAR